MKKLGKLAVFLVVLASASVAHAITIENTVALDLTSTNLSEDELSPIPGSDPYDSWSISSTNLLDETVTALGVGDTLLWTILFDDGLGLRIGDTGGGSNLGDGLESLTWTLLSDSAQQTNLTWDIEFLSATGDLLQNPVAGFTDTCTGVGICSTGRANLLDSGTQASFGGMRLTISPNSFGFGGPEILNITRYNFRISADDIAICSRFPGGGATGSCFPGPGPFPVPEPGTLALLGIGLLGMAAARRRRKA